MYLFVTLSSDVVTVGYDLKVNYSVKRFVTLVNNP